MVSPAVSIQPVRVVVFTILLRSVVGKTTDSSNSPSQECAHTCNLNNGFCEPNGSCSCFRGWKGESCDQCIRAVGCRHGTCQQPNQCICEEGFGGRHCQLDMKYCERHSPCQNGATCQNDGMGSYSCQCRSGFVGKTCAFRSNPVVRPPLVNSNEASIMKCKNGGTCNDKKCTTCSCPFVYVGRHCERKLELCVTSPCANGARCRNLGGSYICECASGFTGKHCEDDVNECSILKENACENGGQCVNLKGSYKCLCPAGFEGTRCKNLVQRLQPSSEKTPTFFGPNSQPKNDLSGLNILLNNQDHTSQKFSEKSSEKSSHSSTNIKVIVSHVEVESADSHPYDNTIYDPSSDSFPDQPSPTIAQAVTFAFLGVAVVLFLVIVISLWCFCSKKTERSLICCCANYKKNLNGASEVDEPSLQQSVPQKEVSRPGKIVRTSLTPTEGLNVQSRPPVGCLYVSLPQGNDEVCQDNEKRLSYISTQTANCLLNPPSSGSIYNCDKFYY